MKKTVILSEELKTMNEEIGGTRGYPVEFYAINADAILFALRKRKVKVKKIIVGIGQMLMILEMANQRGFASRREMREGRIDRIFGMDIVLKEE